MSEKFKILLETTYNFPCHYEFKFVVPAHAVIKLREVFELDTFETKESRNGKYVSVTIKKFVDSSHDVIRLYTECQIIEGLIAL